MPLSSSSVPIDDPRMEPRTTHELSIQLPLGLTLEEMDVSDCSYGVAIIGISTDGNAAKMNSNVFSDTSSIHQSSVAQRCICIRDKIMSVNGIPCQDKSLDDVIELIANSDSQRVTLGLGRIEQSTVLHYSQGRCIAAKPGESYGFLAQKCGVDVTYECRIGQCLTCSRWMEFPDKMNTETKDNVYQRTILNCVGTVPNNYEWLNIFDGK